MIIIRFIVFFLLFIVWAISLVIAVPLLLAAVLIDDIIRRIHPQSRHFEDYFKKYPIFPR